MTESDLADRYWRWQRLSRGGRAERLAAEASAEPYQAVLDALLDPTTGVDVIDSLLHYPDADPVTVGCGPLEDLLAESPEAAELVATKCRLDPAWREAARYVVLARPVPAALVPYIGRGGG